MKMAKPPTDKQQAYIAKKKAQDNEKYLQEEWLRKKNRLLSRKKRMERIMRNNWTRREKERQEKLNKI